MVFFFIQNVLNRCAVGWVLSPNLFHVYNNNLCDKFEKSCAGCYIGHIFMGTFAIILLAACKKLLCVLLDTCKQVK